MSTQPKKDSKAKDQPQQPEIPADPTQTYTQSPIPKSRPSIPKPLLIGGLSVGGIVVVILLISLLLMSRNGGGNGLENPDATPFPKNSNDGPSQERSEVDAQLDDIETQIEAADPSELDLKPPPLDYNLRI